MKKILGVSSVLSVLLLPSLAFAGAYNDVTLTTSAAFSVGGVELDVYSSSAVIESVTVNASNMTVTLLPGSSVTVSSPGKIPISESGGSTYVSTSECDSTASKVGFTYPAGAGSDVTITLTPLNDTCSGPSGSGGGGGGGGGGGSTTTASTTTTTTTTTTSTTGTPALTSAQINAILGLLVSFNADADTIAKVQAALNGSGSVTTTTSTCTFNRDLDIGSSGSDVTCLQTWLIGKGYSIHAGVTGYFGLQTQAAVAAWQKAVGISPTAGYFGAKSRAYLQAHGF